MTGERKEREWEREMTLITRTGMKEDITIDVTEIEKILMKYCEQLYDANKV